MEYILKNSQEVVRRMWKKRKENWEELLKGGLRVRKLNIEKVMDVFMKERLK